MKFTLSWLRDHLDTDTTIERITDTLTSIGLEVEGVENRAEMLRPFVTARVIEAVRHPNADRLRVCRVDTGAGAETQVVCGAPNARTGMAAVFAPPGAFVPGTGITLKVGEIRGVQSAGMLVSQRELQLGDNHDGIIELPEGTAPGQSYAAWAGLDDPLVEIGVTPNRGDALAVRGIARDLAAAGLGRLKPWSPAPVHGPASAVAWRIEYQEGCPWVLGRTIRGVRNGASPEWLQRRLLAVGLRPISALVDVTNYFAYDLGRPLHVFDADRIAGDTLTIRRGLAGEAMLTLDDKTYAVADDIVIADASGIVSLAGVMGGKGTGVSADTVNVFVECALFDPVRIARTGRRHQLHSDARARFERGVDQAALPAMLDAATAMIVSLCGGEPSAPASAGQEPAWRRTATMRFDRLAGLSGAEIPADEATAILERLGFAAVERDDARITVSVPPWRNDVAIPATIDQGGQIDAGLAERAREGAALAEPECDLIEEVLRIHGIDRIAPVSLPVSSAVPAATLTPRQSRAALARRVLASRGLAECVTFSFMRAQDAALFGGDAVWLRIANPIASDLDQMRPTPLATLVPAAQRNLARGQEGCALFEVGPAYAVSGQSLVAAALRAGQKPRHWSGGSAAPSAMEAKADLWAVLTALGVPMDSLSTTQDAPAWYHPGRSAVIRQGPRLVLARFGELHPNVTARLGLDGVAAAFELFLDAIPDPRRRRRAPPDLPTFQPVRRDFAFVLPVETPADGLLRAVRGAERALIAGVGLFDVYEGDKLEPGRKSLGVEVVLQPREKTLTDAEIDAVSARIVQAAKNFGAKLR